MYNDHFKWSYTICYIGLAFDDWTVPSSILLVFVWKLIYEEISQFIHNPCLLEYKQVVSLFITGNYSQKHLLFQRPRYWPSRPEYCLKWS